MFKIKYTDKQTGFKGYIDKVVRGYPKYSKEGKTFKSGKILDNNLSKCLEFKTMIDNMCKHDQEIEFEVVEIKG